MGIEVAALGLGELFAGGAAAGEIGAGVLGGAELGAAAGELGAGAAELGGAAAAGGGLAEAGLAAGGVGSEVAGALGEGAALGGGLGSALGVGAEVGGAASLLGGAEVGAAAGELGAGAGELAADLGGLGGAGSPAAGIGLDALSGVDPALGEASSLGTGGSMDTLQSADTLGIEDPEKAQAIKRGASAIASADSSAGDTAVPGRNLAGGGGGGGANDNSVFGGSGKPAAGGGGMFGGLTGTDALKYGVPLAGLAFTALRGEQALPPQTRGIMDLAGAEGSMAKTFLQAGEAGQITPAQAAQIAIYKQNAINQLRQQFANAGRTPDSDSAYLQGVQQIEQQAVAMQQQFIDSLIKNGMAAAGGATAALTSVANMQIQEDKNFQTAIGDAMKAVGTVYGSSGQRQLVVRAA
jgi:hypothetical protein